MSLLKHTSSLFTIALVALLLSSCDLLWPDQVPEYWYKVENNTPETLQVTLEADGPIRGNRLLQWSVAPSQTFTIWGETGAKEEGRVFDFERNRPRMTHFRRLEIRGTGNLQNPRTNFNAPQSWRYNRSKPYEATYTLPVTTADFY